MMKISINDKDDDELEDSDGKDTKMNDEEGPFIKGQTG